MGGVYVLMFHIIILNQNFFPFVFCFVRLRLLKGLADLRKKTPLSILKTRNISRPSIHAGFKRFLALKNVTWNVTRPSENVTRCRYCRPENDHRKNLGERRKKRNAPFFAELSVVICNAATTAQRTVIRCKSLVSCYVFN